MKSRGIHLYINVKNFNQIVENTEESKMARVIHYLDTYFSSIEEYAKEMNENVTIEKITGARLHMYIVGDVSIGLKTSWEIAKYSVSLCKFMDEEIYKLRGVNKFSIQVGACYGEFYTFNYDDGTYKEETSIGYAANFAAKLQNLASIGQMAISKSIYDNLENQSIKKQFIEKDSSKILKYRQNKYYVISLHESSKHFKEHMFEIAKNKANKINMKDINFSGANELIKVNNLSVSNAKKVSGIPLFADVRGFTTMFNVDDSNLEEMKSKTTKLLKAMKDVVENCNGVHIQFQGDREVALFHNYGERSCIKYAIFASMRLIDAIGAQGLSIGIGEDFGKVFLARIGARGEKDNIMVGNVVLDADSLEDDYADKNEIAISSNLFDLLKKEDEKLASIFQKQGDYYSTKITYKNYSTDIRNSHLLKNTSNKTYNGAWRNEK